MSNVAAATSGFGASGLVQAREAPQPDHQLAFDRADDVRGEPFVAFEEHHGRERELPVARRPHVQVRGAERMSTQPFQESPHRTFLRDLVGRRDDGPELVQVRPRRRGSCPAGGNRRGWSSSFGYRPSALACRTSRSAPGTGSRVELSRTAPETNNGSRGSSGRYERKLWMRDLVMGVAYPPVDH
jgi:hypothetical protein